jgi:hypothetical protein
VRDVEALLARRDLADPPTAARLARLSGGRGGLAVAYAEAPEAEAIRNELTRTLLDLLRADRATRLLAAKGLVARAGTLAALLSPAPAPTAAASPRGRGRAGRPVPADTADARTSTTANDTSDSAPAGTVDEPAAKASASERRRALAVLLDAWRDVARDLSLAQVEATADVRDVALLEELEAAARSIPDGAAAAALARLVRATELVDSNVSPELVLDVLVLRWPHARVAA